MCCAACNTDGKMLVALFALCKISRHPFARQVKVFSAVIMAVLSRTLALTCVRRCMSKLSFKDSTGSVSFAGCCAPSGLAWLVKCHIHQLRRDGCHRYCHAQVTSIFILCAID